MKTKNFKIWVLALTTGFLAVAGEEVTPLVMGEYAKIQNEFQAGLATSRRSIASLQGEKKRVTAQYQLQAKAEQAGIDALKKYDLLLGSRYSNERGEYQAGLELGAKDVENLNRIFENLMRTTPFVGKTSAGYARRQIEWGMKRLEELSKLHSDPTEQNNPELEIIAKQLRDAETKIKTVTDLAGRLGVKLNENIAFEPAAAPQERVPASEQHKSSKR